MLNNESNPINVWHTVEVIDCVFKNNNTFSATATTGINTDGSGAPRFRNCLIGDSGEFSLATTVDGFVWSYDHDQIPKNHWGFSYGATINWDTTVTQSSAYSGSWKIFISNNVRGAVNPVVFKVAEIACLSGSTVNVNVWVKKSTETNIRFYTYIKGPEYTLPGVVETKSFASDITDWQTTSVSFTPSRDGVVPIYTGTYYVSASGYVNVGPIEVTQT
jgi:hypothetical protein